MHAQSGSYKDYCNWSNYTFPNGTAVERCRPVTTPLSLFYGNEFYNVSDVDLADLDTPNFDNITELVLQQRITEAYSTFGTADTTKVVDVITKLLQWSYTGWQQPVDCRPATLQDPTRVKTLFAKMKDIESLRFVNAFSTGVFFDSAFSSTNLKSKYTRALPNRTAAS